MIKPLKSSLLLGVAVVAIALPEMVIAQTAAPAPAPSDMAPAPAAAAPGATPPAAASPGMTTASGSDDIIVTAQRRDESLSRTPVAVAVVTADTLVKAQVNSQQDLRVVTPGLSIRAGYNSNQLNFALRGQSQDPLSDTTPGVVSYFNEVQVGGTASASAFYDLQSVQVLKGPQGTLFGRSATGGAVLFSTAKPDNDFGGYISGTGGNYSFKKFEGAINVPLVKDDLLFRLAGVYQARGGFQRNLFDGGRDGDYKRYGFRPSLTANFGPSIHNELVVDYLHSSGSNTIASIAGLVPFTGSGSPYIPIQALYAGTATPVAQATGIGTVTAFLPPAFAPLVPGFYNGYFAPGTGHPAGGINQVLADQLARGPYVVDSDGNNVFRSKSVVLSNATTIDIAPDVKIKNILGYQHGTLFNASDSDGTPYLVSQSSTRGQPAEGSHETNRQVSDEVQLLGSAFSDRLSYVTGFYFADQRLTRNITSLFFGVLLGGQSQINAYSLTSRTYAGYGQATYKLNDSGLAATVGVRYTSEKVGKELNPGDSFRVAFPVAPTGYDYDQSQTYKRVSWQFGLQDQISPSTLLYAVSRRAYKSGGFNGTVSPFVGDASVAGDAYKAERVTDAEAGAKFKGRIAGMPARLSVAGFYNWIDNSQRLAFTLSNGNPASLTVNVPKGTTYGGEVEANINPIRWLSVGAAVNYTHATYANKAVFVAALPQTFDQVPDTPKLTGSVYADVTVPVTGDLNLLVHGDAYRQTRSFTTPRSQNDAGAVIRAYTLANFRVGIEDNRAGWTLTGNVKNAFNHVYYVGGLSTGEIFQINTLVPGEPRTFTVEARFKF